MANGTAAAVKLSVRNVGKAFQRRGSALTVLDDISFEVDTDPNAAPPKIGEELVAPAGKTKKRAGKPNPNSGVIWHFSAIDGDPKVLNNTKVPVESM